MKKIKELFFKYKEVIMYLIFGVLTTIVSIASYFLLTAYILKENNQLHIQTANVISWILALVFAYITNKKYVFDSKQKQKGEFFKFAMSRISTLILEIIIMYLGVSLLKQNDKIIKIIAQVLVIVSNYILSKLFVFRAKKGGTDEKNIKK